MKNNKWFNFISGIDEQRDEYQLKEINSLLANIGLVLWSSDMLLLVVLIITDTYKGQLSFATAWLCVVNFGLSLYFYFVMRKKGLSTTELETEEELKVYKRKAGKRAFVQALIITAIVFLVTGVILPLSLGESFRFGWLDLLKLIGLGIIFNGGWLYLLAILQVKKYKED